MVDGQISEQNVDFIARDQKSCRRTVIINFIFINLSITAEFLMTHITQLYKLLHYTNSYVFILINNLKHCNEINECTKSALDMLNLARTSLFYLTN